MHLKRLVKWLSPCGHAQEGRGYVAPGEGRAYVAIAQSWAPDTVGATQCNVTYYTKLLHQTIHILSARLCKTRVGRCKLSDNTWVAYPPPPGRSPSQTPHPSSALPESPPPSKPPPPPALGGLWPTVSGGVVGVQTRGLGPPVVKTSYWAASFLSTEVTLSKLFEVLESETKNVNLGLFLAPHNSFLA